MFRRVPVQRLLSKHLRRRQFFNVVSSTTSDKSGCFGLKGLHYPEDWKRIGQKCVQECEDISDQIRNSRDKVNSNVLQLFDDLSNRFCRILDVAELCRNVHPDLEFVKAADETYTNVSRLIQVLNSDFSLYEPLAILHDRFESKDSNENFSPEDLVMVKSLKTDFERGGIDITGHRKEKLLQLQTDILSYGDQFVSTSARNSKHIELPDSKLRLLPRNFQTTARKSSSQLGYSIIPFNEANFHTLLKWLPDSQTREKVFRAAHNLRGTHNERALDSLLRTRHQLARTLNQDSYADLVFDDRLASHPDGVIEFLKKLSLRVQNQARKERISLETEKARHEWSGNTRSQTRIHHWDRSYYIGRLKAQDYDISSYEISQYLSLRSCLNAITEITRSIFGIDVVRVPMQNGESWHEDVEKLELIEKNGEILGHIYLDLNPRKGKYGHAAHFAISCGRQIPGTEDYQIPAVALVCNFGRDVRDGIRLLSISEYETLFHEFGHSLHSVLSRTKYQHLSGTRVATDFVEIPSHLFEHFAWDPRVISRFAQHYRTSDPMPTRLIRSLCASRQGFACTDIQTQILYAVMDLEFHGKQPPIGETTSTFENLQKELTVYEPDIGIPIPAGFHHLVGYGAGYYSYIFARVLSAQLWRTLFEKDPFSKDGGSVLRYGLLAYGGSQDPAMLLQKILPHVSCQAFLDNLGVDNREKGEELQLPLANRTS